MSKSISGMRDPYEDQLAAARYRAERDQARQELDRIKSDRSWHACADAGMLLSEEDRGAIRWVREHGGLERIKAKCYLADETAKVVTGKDSGMSTPVAILNAMCNRLMPEGCEMECAVGIMIEYRRVLNGVCKRLGLTDGTGMPEQDGVIYGELEKRLMPEGMEWPRYEGGEPVKPGSWLQDNDGEAFEAVSFVFTCDWWGIRGYRPDRYGTIGPKYRRQLDGMAYGTPAKRPAVLAADGKPLEVGQTVFGIDSGHEIIVDGFVEDGSHGPYTVDCHLENGGEQGYYRPEKLTHQRPVLDADGIRIEPAMDVWWICEGDERGIHAEKLHVDGIDGDGMVECHPYNGGTSVVLDPTELYVKKPVIDAYGVPIKVGDTVWHIETGREYVVVEPSYGETVVVRLAKYDDAEGEQYTPDQLTHTKPEPPDSWERIEADAKLAPGDYIEKHGRKTDLYAYEEMPIDLVRRCKALAERGE